MQKDLIHNVLIEVIRTYKIPKEPKMACSMEKIMRMRYKNASLNEVREVIRDLIKEEV